MKASSSDSGACSDSDFEGHTPTPAQSPVSDSSFNETVVSPYTQESMSPDIPPSRTETPIDEDKQDSDVEIIYQTPSNEDIISKSSTPDIPLSQYPLLVVT